MKIVDISNKSSHPTSAFLVQSYGAYATDINNLYIIEVIQTYTFKGHSFSTMQPPSLVEWNHSGKSTIGIEGHRGFKPILKDLRAYEFTVMEGREAK